MDFIEVSKRIMNGEKIVNIPLRVCFYARVSTDSEVQLNSLNNQLAYYENYIKTKPNWTYIKGYIDEGISGVRVEKRIGFQRMIEDAKRKEFDLIITKEVSRFARDLEDSIHYIRLLKEMNVGIYFENQNLNTFDLNSELILNIMFNLAQDESRKLSSRIKFGQKEAIKKGHVLGSSNIMGYKKDKCRLTIVEEEATFIKKLYELYSTGEYGFYKLSKKLAELGYYNRKGNLFDKDTLKRMIENPKYKGYYRGKTTEIIDYRTKKRNRVKIEDQILYKCMDGSIPSIVSEELWDRANEILKGRKNTSHNNHSSGSLKYPFSSKIYCEEHNVTFQRSHGSKNKKRPTWSCSRYLQYRLSSCISPIIAEKDLYNICLSIMNSLRIEKEKVTRELLSYYEKVEKENHYQNELESINKKLHTIEEKKSMVLDLVYKKELKKEELISQFKRFEMEIDVLNQKREKVLEQINIWNHSKENSRNIKKDIEEEIKRNCLDDFIRTFIDKIIVFKIDSDRYHLKLDIYLNLTGLLIPITNRKDSMKKKSYLLNQEYLSVDKVRKNRKTNHFIYNVYIESISNTV